MNSTCTHKNRVRPRRGKLECFSNLPFCAQTKFKILAKEVKEIDSSIEDVYVFGSWFWGVWDKDSDYDIRINTGSFPYSQKEFRSYVFDKYQFPADIMILRPPKKDKKLIKIPV
mgnify:CR=1 FL=1|tara:strand:- start:5847 stop:6188 length:342 start_codon:yes stop_codon:yes gene_type:complete